VYATRKKRKTNRAPDKFEGRGKNLLLLKYLYPMLQKSTPNNYFKREDPENISM